MAASFDYEPFESDYPEPLERDEYTENAMVAVEEVIATQRVVTGREVKVRLEDKFFPWVTGRALESMVENGRIVKVGLPGRKGRKFTKNFYTLPDFDYNDIVGEIQEKRSVSMEVNAMLTGHAPATFFAEDLFERAFNSLGFEIVKRDASEYNGRKVTSVEGKQPPNLDFILRRDGVVYGVDVKNWIRYEFNTRKEVILKVSLALQLQIAPFIIARYVDKDAIYTEVISKGGICYPYRTLLFSPNFASLARRANSLLGYPTMALDRLPTFKVQRVDFLHEKMLARRKID
jgi:hypothetical protein